MMLIWKNYAHDAFRIVAILHICSAVRGQTSVQTSMKNAMPEKTTQATSAVQGQTSMNNVTPDKITQKTSPVQGQTSMNNVTPDKITQKTSPVQGQTSMNNVTPDKITQKTSPVQATTSSSSMKMTSENIQTKKTTNRIPDTPSTADDPINTSKSSSTMRTPNPTPPGDNASTIVIIIVLVAAIIVIFIAIVTAVCLCCCKGNRREEKGYSSPEHNGKVNGLAKDQPPSGLRRSNEINGYETVNEKEQVDNSSTSVDKPSLTDPNCYSNEGLTDEDEKNHVNTASDERYQLAEKSKTKTGNIFDDIDPTTTYSHHVYNEHDHEESTRVNNRFQEQIELNPSKSPTRANTPEEERTLEAPKSATGQLTDKGRETVTPPKPVVRRNISNRNDNIIKLRPKPQPRARPVSRALQDDVGTAEDNASPGNETRDSSTTADPPSSTSYQEKQRMFRPPLKGKGPDGSDQAALLANVLRKSNAPRQIEEDNSVNKEEGTTYW